jgi:hypothetical protein
MSDQATNLDLSELSVQRIQAAPAAALDTAEAHGMSELAASCGSLPFPSAFVPEDWDWAEA